MTWPLALFVGIALLALAVNVAVWWWHNRANAEIACSSTTGFNTRQVVDMDGRLYRVAKILSPTRIRCRRLPRGGLPFGSILVAKIDHDRGWIKR